MLDVFAGRVSMNRQGVNAAGEFVSEQLIDCPMPLETRLPCEPRCDHDDPEMAFAGAR